jgi:hypothetical protein
VEEIDGGRAEEDKDRKAGKAMQEHAFAVM